MLIQGNGPPIADIIGSLLSGAGNYIAGSENAKRQNAQLKMQQDAAAQNAQLTALSIANQKGQLRASGTNPDGSQAADPYTASRQQGPDPASFDPLYGQGVPGQQAATTPDNINDHIAALLAAGQTGPAQNLRQGQQAQNAQTTFNNQQTTFDQGQLDRDAAATTAAGLQQFQQGLQYPKNWNTMSAMDQIKYLQNRQLAAQQHGDKQTYDQTSAQIKEIQGPADLATKLENQRAMLEQKFQFADQLQQARITAALNKMGQSGPMSEFQFQELLNHSTDKAEEKRRFELTHNPDGTPKTNRQDQALTGQVETLRRSLDSYRYKNNIDDGTPQGRAKIAAWIAGQSFPSAAVSQVAPYAVQSAPVAPVTTAPQANVLHNKSKSGKPIHSSDGGKTWVYD